MIIILCIYSVLITALAIHYYRKAKEFESLFELSKGYEWPANVESITGVWTAQGASPKLNKDGSIAKKRGRPSKNAK